MKRKKSMKGRILATPVFPTVSTCPLTGKKLGDRPITERIPQRRKKNQSKFNRTRRVQRK